MSRKSKKTLKLQQDVPDHKSSDMPDNTKEDYYMYFTEYRLKTFEDWPFDQNDACTPASLAAAGFYHVPSKEAPDATICFCCFKELDCWESSDNPWTEHQKHSPHCAFLSMNKTPENLTVEEFIKLECERQRNKIRKFINAKKQEFEFLGTKVRSELLKLK